jgi:hypothetical protein
MFSQKQFLAFARGSLINLTITVLALLAFPLVPAGTTSALAQVRESTMEQRTKYLLAQLSEAKDCETARTAVQLAIDVTVANNRVIVSKGVQETGRADQMVGDSEMMVAEALGRFAQQQGKCPDVAGLALDVKLLIEQGNEVARALRQFTEKCGDGDSVYREPCDQLQPLLDEDGGREILEPRLPGAAVPNIIIRPGFSVKLRGPFVPPYIRQMQEDVRVTAPIGAGQCVVVFKETKGLMLRLIFVRMTIVLDPWATPLLLRGTRIPVWALQWVPSEHVKEWNICNVNGTIKKTVTQRVVQDIPLNYFWRFYPKDP